MTSPAFDQISSRLYQVRLDHAGRLTVRDESRRRFSLVAGKHPKHKTPMPIAWVEVGKSYVGYHLMPILERVINPSVPSADVV
ncbi:MAG TPA: hypothetical protein VL992_08970 [Tepidisphaeraceae bacterium]|nr:hypothetical protein [Tepidisphaeraceae bacterium]